MKDLATILIVFIMAFILIFSAFAATYSSSTENVNPSNVDSTNITSTNVSSSEENSIQGTVVVWDPETSSLTVTDFVTGGQRKFTIDDKSEFKNIKTGDKVRIIPQSNNPNAAKKIERDETD